ncbi:MAG: hypothetical protein NZ870_04735, partial [bacterium]|nr:hypothetical protein [bacterium]
LKLNHKFIDLAKSFDVRVALLFIDSPEFIKKLGFGKNIYDSLIIFKKLTTRPEYKDARKINELVKAMFSTLNKKDKLKKILNSIASIKTEDLIKMGITGRDINQVLSNLFYLRYKGKIKNLQDELDYIKNLKL